MLMPWGQPGKGGGGGGGHWVQLELTDALHVHVNVIGFPDSKSFAGNNFSVCYFVFVHS